MSCPCCKASNLSKAVGWIKKNKEIRGDRLESLGVEESELKEALKKEGLNFIVKDYSGGIFGDDNPFEDHPESVYLDLVIDESDDDGPGGIDY